MTQLTPARIRVAEYARNVHVVVVPVDVTLDDALAPAFWAHVANLVKPWDKIEVRPEDDAWFAEMVVFKATRHDLTVRVLHAVDDSGLPLHVTYGEEVGAKPNEEALPRGYDVTFGGPIHKWRVLRTSDGEVLTHGLSKKDAIQWAHDNAAAAV